MNDQNLQNTPDELLDDNMSEREMLLQRAFDGELSPKEREAFENLSREDSELLAEWDALQNVREHFCEAHQADVARFDFSNFYEGIAKELGIAEAPAKQPGFFERLTGWWKRYWTPVAVSAAVAVVAGLITVNLAKPVSEEVQIEQVINKGSGLVLISQPTEEGEVPVLWTWEDEADSESDKIEQGEEAI